MSTPNPTSRFAPYKNALQAISLRTGASLPALAVSFAVLHEITAIVPVVGVFYGARALGVGERIVGAVLEHPQPQAQQESPHQEGDGNYVWLKGKARTWVVEGDEWAEKVGRRYGFFGYEKGSTIGNPDIADVKGRIAGDVANAIVAYGVGKALFPVRIGVSMYLAPAMARFMVEPFRKTVLRIFRN